MNQNDHIKSGVYRHYKGKEYREFFIERIRVNGAPKRRASFYVMLESKNG